MTEVKGVQFGVPDKKEFKGEDVDIPTAKEFKTLEEAIDDAKEGDCIAKTDNGFPIIKPKPKVEPRKRPELLNDVVDLSDPEFVVDAYSIDSHYCLKHLSELIAITLNKDTYDGELALKVISLKISLANYILNKFGKQE